jgi:hypothetical protein
MGALEPVGAFPLTRTRCLLLRSVVSTHGQLLRTACTRRHTGARARVRRAGSLTDSSPARGAIRRLPSASATKNRSKGWRSLGAPGNRCRRTTASPRCQARQVAAGRGRPPFSRRPEELQRLKLALPEEDDDADLRAGRACRSRLSPKPQRIPARIVAKGHQPEGPARPAQNANLVAGRDGDGFRGHFHRLIWRAARVRGGASEIVSQVAPLFVLRWMRAKTVPAAEPPCL